MKHRYAGLAVILVIATVVTVAVVVKSKMNYIEEEVEVSIL